jgi:colanic acid biosynthesis glycosyl transferase WcaI
MKIFLLNQYYPPDSAPTGQYLHDVARALVQRGHTVTVFCSQRAYNGDERYPLEEKRDGVWIHRIRASGFGRRHSIGKMLDYATFYVGLMVRLLASRRQPDIMMALTTPPHLGLLAAWAARVKGCVHAHWVMDVYPDVLAAHGVCPEQSWLYRFLGWLTRCELRDSPLVVALGDDMADRLRRYVPAGADASVVVSLPLWCDPSLQPWPEGKVVPFRTQQGWSDRDLVVMYSGNMGRGHRLGEFLAAAKRTSGQPDMQWVFAGGGKRRAEVETFLQQHPDAQVRLLPYAPAERLGEHLSSADVHLASLEERWQGCMVPSKLQGIFAVGRPVLFVGGRQNSLARWIEESGGGWVVAPEDGESLLQALRQARQVDERRCRGQAARAFAESHFDRDRNVNILCTRLELAVQERAGNGVATSVVTA